MIFLKKKLRTGSYILNDFNVLLGSINRWLHTLIQVPLCFQVARSTAVADEALGNVRTVRAFAMETKENE